MKESWRFFILGDWGRCGSPEQLAVAEAMAARHEQGPAEAIFTVGDNFYPDGLASANDAHWQESFHAVYSPALRSLPWYTALGNHDYRGNIHHQFKPAAAPCWRSPGPYYALHFPTRDILWQVLFIDTTPWVDEYRDPFLYPQRFSQNPGAQRTWLERQLKCNGAGQNLIIGHHPLYTAGARRSEFPWMQWVLNDLLSQYPVTAYFAGHEHDLQHHQVNGVQHFGCGAGSEVRECGRLKQSVFTASLPGFVELQLKPRGLAVEFISGEGTTLHRWQQQAQVVPV